MTLNDWSANWAAIAAALGNHLWQSTMFLIAAGLLTLCLRKNPARARYWIWLTASVKFLIPFSLFITIGSHLSRRAAGTNGGFYHAIDAVGQPFPLPLIPETSGSHPSTVLPSAGPLVPILLAVWLGGFLVVAFLWFVRWRGISATVRKAAPLREGREVEALRRLERIKGARKQTEILLSPASLEPGIFGIARPILLWPEGLSKRLDDAHLEAILAHELWHVRRRDNLAAAFHMLVEAIFWFHPLVWWLRTRLVEERERACDEEVLKMGSDRQVYAESILKICEFCVESPLACVSGVTGSDLKKRIEAIMTNRKTRSLELSRKLLLGAMGVAGILGPLVFGLLHSPQSRAELRTSNMPITSAFEVASVQPSPSGEGNTGVGVAPGRITLANWTVKGLLLYAYNLEPVGGPGWIEAKRYDIDVRVNDALAYKSGRLIETNVAGRFPPGLRHDQLRLTLQSLLANEFKLRLSRETRRLPVYALVVANGGPKLHEAKVGDTYADGIVGPDGLTVGPNRGTGQDGRFTAQALPMPTVAEVLTKILGRTVIDETGLNGEYDFTLEWPPIKSHSATEEQQDTDSASPESVGPSIFTAIQEQLGLKLESRETPVEVLAIDHVEKPVESQAQEALPPIPAFESATIKPNNGEPMAGFTIVGKPFKAIMWKGDRLMATNFTLHGLIRAAYGIPDDQILGGPDWLTTEGYDLDAKMEESVADEMRKRGPRYGVSGRTLMFQKLLSDRFKLSFHRETRDIPVYALVVATNGPKLHPAKPDDTYANGLKKSDGSPLGANILSAEEDKLIGQGIPVAKLVEDLSAEYYLHRTVLDKTGLAGRYDFTLQRTPQQNQSAILVAIQQQLGLRVEPQTAPVEVLVVDHAEKPSEN